MKILTFLVTGGSGFIGSSLVDTLLSLGHKVINIDNMNDYYDASIKFGNIKQARLNPNYHFFQKDICDFDEIDKVFAQTKIDFIIHLAARAGVRPSIDNPILYQNTNCLGTNIIFELAKKYGINKIISASSSSVYGNNIKTPFSETDIVDYAISPYAATKKANEVMGHVYHSLYGIDMIFHRFFTVYGPRQRPDLAIYKFVDLIEKGIPIQMFGDGSSSRDYTFIDDIVEGIISSINYLFKHNNVFEIINLGNCNPISLFELIQSIQKALGKKAKIIKMPMQPGDVNATYANIDKAKRILGFEPKTSFSIGLKKFVDWYRKNQEDFK
jgi:UDP-glucuronate 4-epimerase